MSATGYRLIGFDPPPVARYVRVHADPEARTARAEVRDGDGEPWRPYEGRLFVEWEPDVSREVPSVGGRSESLTGCQPPRARSRPEARP